MAKTNKSILKRMRITPHGKILRAGVGINHFQAKKTRSAQLQKKRQRPISPNKEMEIRSYLYHG
ncbi:MAG TPA: 50S ribosomal protein L35 [Candidatus Paceibacterota bacterium]